MVPMPDILTNNGILIGVYAKNSNLKVEHVPFESQKLKTTSLFGEIRFFEEITRPKSL